MNGTLTIGGLVAFMAYHGRLLGPFQNLMSLYQNLVMGAVSLGRVSELFRAPIQVRELPDARRLGVVGGEVNFDEVVFRHDSAPVLQGVSFHLRPGTVAVLLGPSGSGKSTIPNLLRRCL